MTDWAAWGTSIGTLVLAGATFAAVRSSNRSARIAERSLLAGLRPVLTTPRRDDPAVEVQFADGRVFDTGWGDALVRRDNGVIYLALQLRNGGAGVAHLVAYRLEPEPAQRVTQDPRGLARHRRGDPAPDPTAFTDRTATRFVYRRRRARLLAGSATRCEHRAVHGNERGNLKPWPRDD